MKPHRNNIFGLITPLDFEALALSVFHHQAQNNEVYARYLSGLSCNPESIKKTEEIPFLPIEFFKSHQVITSDSLEKNTVAIYTSSGTTGSLTSSHFVLDVTIYEESYLKSFDLFYGKIESYCILALLPSYLEREGSSLIYMAEDLIKKTTHPDSGFYLNNYDALILKLKSLEERGQKTILIGVTYALLDLLDKETFQLKNTIIMETGGMKGKRKEMVREELHSILCKGFGVDAIHSEYGMTELLSQAYSNGNGRFICPPWMKILIRDTNDPFSYMPTARNGGINVIDLANINSCSFIATQDLGKVYADNSFEVLGRFDNSDIRGCNLLVQ